jgi:hypothetical protein
LVSAKEISPGGETEVKATLSTKHRHGTLRKAVTVFSNDPKTPKLVLTLKGEVTTDIVVKPSSFYFGRLKKGEKAEKTFSAVSSEPEKIRILSVRIEHDRFTLHPSPDVETTGNYTLRFKGGRELGVINTAVDIRYRSDRERHTKIPVRLEVIGDLIYTQYVRFFERDGKFPVREVTFSSRSGKPVVLKSARDPHGLLKLTIDRSDKKRPKVRAEVKNGQTSHAGPKRYEFNVRTGDRDQPVVRVGYTIAKSRHNKLNPR